MSYPIHTAIEAEVAYRRERLLGQYRPAGRVGSVRETRRAARAADPTVGAVGAGDAGTATARSDTAA